MIQVFLMALAISEVVQWAQDAGRDITRQAVYKALSENRLTLVVRLGKKGVKEDGKLEQFLGSERLPSKRKPSGINGLRRKSNGATD